MDRQSAIRKVLRCLRLASSSNPNEAAAALRQARAMMAEHGLTESDAYASEIHQASAATRCRGSAPSESLMFLIAVVERGFRCKAILFRKGAWENSRFTVKTSVLFYGAGSDAQVGAYAFAVLRRQLEADKARYTRRVRVRKNKEARGEQFAIGWVAAVLRQFPADALADDRTTAIAAAVSGRHGSLRTVTGRAVGKGGKTNENDGEAGYIAGSLARVNPGLDESAQRKLEHAP